MAVGVGRLQTPADFVRVLAGKRLAQSRHFELYVASSPVGVTVPRLGLAMSRKCAPTAVLRNLAKRLARERFRGAARTGIAVCDVVVRARPVLGTRWRAAKASHTVSALRRELSVEMLSLMGRLAGGAL